jgi:hypothetical protein
MKSHQYNFSLRELAGGVLPTLGILVGLAVLLHLGDSIGLLPEPPVGLIPESVVLHHQSRACRSESAAEILVMGDSTCLAGTDALALSRQLPGRPHVLSLALFVWLDVSVYGEEVADFAAAHPGQLRAVVLLVTPAKLAGWGLGEDGRQLWDNVHHPKRPTGQQWLAELNNDWLGAQLMRERMFSHLLATPLRGKGAAQYGFGSEIDAYMTVHQGSLAGQGESIPPRKGSQPVPVASHLWPLAAGLEAPSRAFRARLPPGVKLFIGLTPNAAASTDRADNLRQADLLRRWNAWVGADALLTNLPPTLPYGFFSGGNHLNYRGQQRFTAKLAQDLEPLVK